jgi:cardiolipin-specific phospholipase
VGIKTFTLVGHSFGGYIAASYCEKYPGHVKRLVLLSPAGTTEKTK